MINFRQFYQGQPGTTATTLYIAPSNNANVPSPYATAMIKEIIACNTTSSAATVTIGISGTAAASQIVGALSIAGNDSKVLSGLDTAVSGGTTIQALQGTAGAITLTISGIEIQ